MNAAEHADRIEALVDEFMASADETGTTSRKVFEDYQKRLTVLWLEVEADNLYREVAAEQERRYLQRIQQHQ